MAKTKKEGLSVRAVTLLSMLVIAWIGWGMAAAGYAAWVEQRGPTVVSVPVPRAGAISGLATMGVALLELLYHSVAQIPRIFSVFGFAFRERLGLVIGIVVVELLAGGGGFLMSSLDQKLEAESRRNRSRS